jgi:serine/threonine protein kinase
MSKSHDQDAFEDRRLEHAIAEYLRRQDLGENVDRDLFLKDHPSCADGLRQYFEVMDQVDRMCGSPTLDDGVAGASAARSQRSRAQEDWDNRDFPFPFGRYKVLSLLGRGGMGSVYEARDTRLDRQVALKVPLLGNQEVDRTWLERFAREAKTSINHPNICTIYDSGVLDGQPFISMAYITGQPLSALIVADNLLPEQESATAVRTVALAMEAVHQAGLIHRDLKPKNIMIDERGQPVVMDFGLARRLAAGEPHLTAAGHVVGSLAYMSPEQLEGKPDDVNHSTDIYSLGVTFYEMLTGRRPFRGSRTQLLGQILVQPPEPPTRLRPDLDRTLEAICLKMMAKRPIERYATMKNVADELDRWLSEKSAKSAAASELRHLRQQVRMLSIGGAIAAGGLGLFEVVEFLESHFSGGGESHADTPPADDLHPHSPSGDGTWHSPFEDHLPEHAPIEKADPQFGTPQHDRMFWEGQQSYADTCAVRCQEYILQQFTGVDFPEKLLVDEAKEHGWYTPGGGTPMQDVGNLLELHGVAVHRYTDANVFHLANELSQGHKVIIGVDSSKLWGHNSTMDSMLEKIHGHFALGGGADHAVVVSGIDTSDPHHVKVLISDPGDGKAVASYPLEQFLHAWEGSHFYMVATQEPAPAHLPEMLHFDYAAGHLSAIADVPYDRFVEQFAHHPEAWEHVLEHFSDEHFHDGSTPGDHADHGHTPWDSADHGHHGFDHNDDHHGSHDSDDHSLHDTHGHGDEAPLHEDQTDEDHHTPDDYSGWQ